MLFLSTLCVILAAICTVSGVWDHACFDNCSCCIDKLCGKAQGFNNSCLNNCTDGHRGARCYELCQYENCQSCGGITASNVCEKCHDGYYLGPKKDCTLQCPSNCRSCITNKKCTKCKEGFYNKGSSTECQYVLCPVNCKCNDQGDCVSCKVGYYDTSNLCLKHCPVNCITCESEESCNECKHGFYNGYEYDNYMNVHLNNCTYACKKSCAQCLSYKNCSQCITGKYSYTCQEDCSVGCNEKLCKIDSGKCTCTVGFTGNKCMHCVNGKHGTYCNQSCPKYCKETKCERWSGNCLNGCLNNNISGPACNICIAGRFGEICDKLCPDRCKDLKCERYQGNCSIGCKENFNGSYCNTCIHGKYGSRCELKCPANCAGNVCDRNSGTCFDCVEHFQGKKCNECELRYYGPNCKMPCSPHCNNQSCNRYNGNCTYACMKGFSGDKCCVMSENCVECESNAECKTCKPGYFKKSCNGTCQGGCNRCDIITGECILGKDRQTEQNTSNLAGPVAGGVVGLVAIVAGMIASVFFLRRRRMRKDSGDGGVTNGHGEHIKPLKEEPEYVNSKETGVPVAVLDDVVLDETNDDELDDETGYYNFNSVNTKIKVDDLFSYVTRDHFDSFEKEFKNLPKPGDLSILCKVAKEPENISSNRYNGIYPFDHSRVTIPGDPNFFINACYINGYSRRNAYIASFGPTGKTTKNFTTFWRMVWHEKSDIIVMLTNLREASGMKCEQYWPEGEETCYGNVNVTCRSVEEFSEYTVRCFTISKGKEDRNVTQVHFTAWPDKGVPSEVTSIIDFRQRVQTAPVVLNGPVIVHCSAGVGRTGTYIALDILSEQGKAEGSVNVFNCVSEMRGQRVSMVQTEEQYIFLHKALVHTLTFGCEAQTADALQSLDFDADSTFTRMFQTLRQEVDIEQDDEIAAREENKRIHADKSRRHSDIPGNNGRVRLYLRRKSGSHDFINAVFINSFKRKNQFVAAQTPLSKTVEDFLCMIYQQNSPCVVSLEDPLKTSKRHDVGLYLPADNEIYKCGEFRVTSAKCENKPQYTIKKLTIKHTDKGEEKITYHFQYTKWGDGRKVADSPGDFVRFIKVVEKYVEQREADIPNVVVHCLNGYERSGLFCVVYTLLEKLEAERQVSVGNAIRKVRTKRKRSISTVEQLKFCYQCISTYLESFNTYSNFAV